MTARRVLLDGLARDADIFELVSELAPLHPRDNNTFPGEVFLHLAADALNWCGASPSSTTRRAVTASSGAGRLLAGISPRYGRTTDRLAA